LSVEDVDRGNTSFDEEINDKKALKTRNFNAMSMDFRTDILAGK
jgi:hypothetical protein